VPEDSLPLVLPDTDNFRPRGTPESPLSVIDEWVNTTDPVGGGPARRETSTMPQVLQPWKIKALQGPRLSGCLPQQTSAMC